MDSERYFLSDSNFKIQEFKYAHKNLLKLRVKRYRYLLKETFLIQKIGGKRNNGELTDNTYGPQEQYRSGSTYSNNRPQEQDPGVTVQQYRS